MRRFVFACSKAICLSLLCLFFVTFMEQRGQADEPTPLELFEQRIVPIFKSPEPSSCVQCHLSSVDLKDYILPSSRATFLALREQGLVDVAHPEQSKILHLIDMGDQDQDRLAKRIHAKTRRAEYDAFSAWIHACCADSELAQAASESTEVVGPAKSLEVVRHNRKDRVLDSFVRNVWSQRMRCFPCHTPNEIDPQNPQHKQATKRQQDFVAQYGARMNLFKATPEATMRAMIASSSKQHDDELPLINVRDPLKSLFLLKPMAKIPPKSPSGDGRLPPSSVEPVSHAGGLKIHKDDFSYKAFAAWLTDYSKAIQDQYTATKELPADNWFPTNTVLRIKEGPQTWQPMQTVQLFVFAWDPGSRAWEGSPIAFTQTKVTPRRLINGTLFLMAGKQKDRQWDSTGAKLSPGKYRIEVYLDREDTIQSRPLAMLNRGKADASAVIDAQWKEGFKNAQVVLGSQFE